MIQVSEALKEAFANGNQKDLTLSFEDGTSLSNQNIVAESMSIEQILCDEEQLTFGLCNAACFKVQIVNSNTSRVGLSVTPTITAHMNGNDYSVQLGVFRIVEDKVTDDRLYRNIVAYDSLYDILNENYVSWYNALTFPMTLKQFRDSFFTHIGINQAQTTLVNDSMTVEKTVKLDEFSGGQILKMICEINGVFGCMDSQDRFRYISFTDSIGLYPEDNLYPEDYLYPEETRNIAYVGNTGDYVSGSFVYEDYVVQEITGLAIVEDENDTSYLYGTDYNLYKITGNYLLFGKNAASLQTVANNFLGLVGNFLYKPAKVTLRGKPWIELGDVVKITGKNTSVFPVLTRTMTGITALYDTYEAKGNKFYEFLANTTSDVMEKLLSRTMRMERNVDGFYQEFQQFESDTAGNFTSQSTRITQTAEAITSEANRASTAEGNLSTRITQTADSITSEVTRATTKEGQLQTSITQNATAITTKVSKDGVISSINQSAEAVTIDANRININGTVSANGYFEIDSNGKVSISGSNGNLHIDDGVLSQWTTDSQGYRNYIGFDQWGAQLNGAGYFNSYSNIFGLNYDSLRFGIKTSMTDLEYGHYGWNEWFLYNRNVGAWAAYPAGIANYDTIKLWCTTGLKQTKESDYSLISQVDGNVVMYYHYGASDQRVIWASGTSSKWMKENISDMTDEEAKKLLNVHVIDFDFKEGFMNGQKGCHGVIAEEIADVIPYAAQYPPNYEEPLSEEDVEPGKTPLPHVNYENLVPHLIKMVQIQQKEIDELKRRISSLEEGE